MISFYWLLLAILLAAYGATLQRVKKCSSELTPLLGWLAGLGFFLIAPLTILTLHGGYELPPADGLTEAWTKVNLSNPEFFRPYLLPWLAMVLTCGTAWALVQPAAARPGGQGMISLPRLERAIRLTMALSVADWVVYVWLLGGADAFLISHWYRRNAELSARLGGSFTVFTRLELANQLLFTGAAALHLSRGLRQRKVRWGFTALIGLFLLLEMAMSGNRIFVAFYLLAFLASSWLYGRKKIVALLLAASPLLVLLFAAWGAVRHDLSRLPDSAAAQAQEVGSRTLSSLMYATEGQGVLLLLHVVNDFGGRFVYLHGATYGRLFTFWLPRSLYPERPLDFTSQAAVCYEPGDTTSLCATALGEAYANFGVWSLLALPGFTWLVSRYERYLAGRPQGASLLSAVSFVVLIWFARCTFAENVFNLVEVGALIWIFRMEAAGARARAAA